MCVETSERPEIEITPAMIEAGAEIVRRHGGEVFREDGQTGSGELAEWVYRAMASAAPVAVPSDGGQPPAKNPVAS